MPIDFPNSPAVNQTYSYNGRLWLWNGVGWAAARQATNILVGVTTLFGPFIEVGGLFGVTLVEVFPQPPTLLTHI